MNTIYRMKTPRSYQDVLAFLDGRSGAEVAHNTDLLFDAAGDHALVYYHQNAIIDYRPRSYSVSLSGWDTVTTRARLCALTPAGAYRVKGVTYVDVGGVKTPLEYLDWISCQWPIEGTPRQAYAEAIYGDKRDPAIHNLDECEPYTRAAREAYEAQNDLSRAYTAGMGPACRLEAYESEHMPSMRATGRE